MSEAARNASRDSRVLVVEDEARICEMLADMLEMDGFEPHCVQTDKGAYDALQHEAFACMVVDVNLGSGTTGYDVARFARRIDPALPIIYVSGQSSPDSFKANGVPGSLFLAKPFTTDELMEQLRKLVGDNDD
jgi:DNA-binding response OmpR family regulator